ncbi:hypothetical protein [Bosea sp. TND4EK4]|uniref:hypothetical protein n=1 Tax=Bosea sp. TND4EK4 TaxID=1907408 RepID=UPI001FCCDA5B|nr:hypothetical protein [Bosea sp. TND4EK4]
MFKAGFHFDARANYDFNSEPRSGDAFKISATKLARPRMASSLALMERNRCSAVPLKMEFDMQPLLTLTLDDADLAKLDRHIARHGSGQTREAAAADILRTFLRLAGDKAQDEGLRPDELNASNDS